ncbi:MAG: mannose-6-phosphate isomerase, class I [Desulfobacterales bacterium]|nr:mannose-6-phosphate isomerase, class I [Desulfobacterales bacterium]
MAMDLKQIFKLDNPIQNYAWGSRTMIASLVGDTVPADQPQAEMWMGAHPKSPSMVTVNEERISLADLIEAHPHAVLGADAARRFDRRMPFLFKVLAAAEPLSIQAHPNKTQALTGFERENRAGLALDAPHRNYRDASHKPEIICALTPFWGLNGFQPITAIEKNLRRYGPETLTPMVAMLKAPETASGLKSFFEALLRLPTQRRTEVIAEATEQAALRDDDPTAEWVLRLHAAYPDDVGILAPIYLNLVRLAPGQAMYLAAGQLHAYLEGLGIELMANSDNVLRGGLTPKHVDVDELSRVLQFSAGDPRILSARQVSAVEYVYATPAEEFQLAQLNLNGNTDFNAAPARSLELLLLVEGAVRLEAADGQTQCRLVRGESVMIPACLPGYRIHGAGQIFRAAVPSRSNP